MSVSRGAYLAGILGLALGLAGCYHKPKPAVCSAWGFERAPVPCYEAGQEDDPVEVEPPAREATEEEKLVAALQKYIAVLRKNLKEAQEEVDRHGPVRGRRRVPPLRTRCP